jgi:Tfp pilus assembly protein PilX
VRPRRGFALIAVLLVLMLIAALAASVFFTAIEEARIGQATADKELALSAAESAIELSIADHSFNTATPIGVDGARSSAVGGFQMPVRVTVTRLDSAVYWIVADAGSFSSHSATAKRIGALVTIKIGVDGSIMIDRIAERWWSELF